MNARLTSGQAIIVALFTLIAAWPHGSRVCGAAAARTSVLRLSGASAAGRRLQTDPTLTSFPTLFTEVLPLPPLAAGICVAVALPDEANITAASAARGWGDGAAPSLLWSALGVPTAGLHAEEVERLGSLRTVGRQLEYAGGRVALRRALCLSGWRGVDALLSNEVGAVRMPPRVSGESGALLLGSISHTRGVAVAIVAGCDDLGDELSVGGGGATSTGEPDCGGGGRSGLVRAPRAAVGVDIESKDRRSVARMARRILADEERATLEVRRTGGWRTRCSGGGAHGAASASDTPPVSAGACEWPCDGCRDGTHPSLFDQRSVLQGVSAPSVEQSAPRTNPTHACRRCTRSCASTCPGTRCACCRCPTAPSRSTPPTQASAESSTTGAARSRRRRAGWRRTVSSSLAPPRGVRGEGERRAREHSVRGPPDDLAYTIVLLLLQHARNSVAPGSW